MAEHSMVGWHHHLNGHEFEQTLGDGEGQGNLPFMGSQRVGHDLVTKQQQQHTYKIGSPKVHLVKAVVFPVVMYGCESWTIKKTEHRRIDAFELWCWRRLLRVPWTARSPTSPS